eukprot:CAMPEP_0197858204 /NCGR_PEP_ID=MMETSP1438-20131217/31830_1 /TAXON_ID=1461541 /ORGANISM="Pterosperma sp., Strain CCMP1384" /LENGTH=71 /DNA_ID=CAMNT_0043474285 /DNA_START=80 /DNA_END=292 /DNA_ORIENTATION=+
MGFVHWSDLGLSLETTMAIPSPPSSSPLNQANSNVPSGRQMMFDACDDANGGSRIAVAYPSEVSSRIFPSI